MAHRKPVRIDKFMTSALNKAMKERGITIPKGITLYVTNTTCGRFCNKNMNITVPTWALELNPSDVSIHENDAEYAIYYACHEIAHALSDKTRVRGVMHSTEFYARFIEVCPAHIQHFELGYKPALAAAAGIKRKAK